MAFAREWWIRKREACGSCGTRKDEWLPSKGGRGNAYRAEISQCPGCAQVEKLQRDLQSDKDWTAERGLKIVLRPNTQPSSGG